MRRKPNPDPSDNPKGLNWGWFLLAGLLLLNAFLVSPYIGWYDSGEMVGTTVCLGVSHPSGQVLFHLLGKLFLLVPLSTPAYRLGLMSAACSALASVLFWTLSCRLAAVVSDPPGKALSTTMKIWLTLLTLAWSLSQPWWVYSLTPLVYALHLLLGMLILWALSLGKPAKWPLALFLLGIATIFRPTQFFALPFLALAFLWEWRKKGKNPSFPIPVLIACFGLGRSIALYLPLRSALHPSMAYADLTHPMALVRQVFALRFSHSVGTNSLHNILHVAGMMVTRLWTDLTPFGTGLLLCGACVVYWKKEKIPVFLWVALGWGLVEALFVFTIPFPTFEPHQVLLGWVYSGFLAALPLIFLEQIFRKGHFRSAVMDILLVAFVLAQLSSIGHLLDRKKERGAEDYARNVLAIMGPDALFMPTEENEYFPVAAYQQSLGFRKDVGILEPGSDPALVAPRIQECLQQGRPLYVTRKWDLPPAWAYQAWGPLLQVVPASTRAPLKKASLIQPAATWGGLELSGVDLWPNRIHAGGIVQVTYRWVRRMPSAQDSSDLVVALFIDPKGNYWMKNGVFWLHDIHEPPAEAFAHMKPDVLYEDQRILFIPSDYPPGIYALTVGLQKQAPAPEQGKEPFNREFYERNSNQDLDKFMGRGENGAVAQFSAGGTEDWKEGLWPVTKSLYPIADPRFVPVAEVEIKANP